MLRGPVPTSRSVSSSSVRAGERARLRSLRAVLRPDGRPLRLAHQVEQKRLGQLPGASLLQSHRLQDQPQVCEEVREDEHVFLIY